MLSKKIRRLGESLQFRIVAVNVAIFTLLAVIAPGIVLQIGESLKQTEGYPEIFSNLFVILIAAVIILSILIGRYLSRQALMDIEILSRTAEEISNGAYHRRVDVKSQLSEINQLSSAFNSMMDHIQGLLTAMKDTNDNIAHDLKSPLAGLRGMAEMTLVGNKPLEDYKDLAVSTMQECDRLIDIINTMLDIAEAEAGINGEAEEEFDLAAIITSACELFRPVADQKAIELNCNMSRELFIKGVRTKMQRVVANLLENAIKYTPNNGRVAVSAIVIEGEIQIDFKDTGLGISEKDLPHIFERFYRCDQSGSQGGSGLGLSLAKAFAESMKGVIQVNSNKNQGSTFTLKFSHGPA